MQHVQKKKKQASDRMYGYTETQITKQFHENNYKNV